MPISLRGTPTSSFRLGAGNVTNPSLSFVNNPSTGLFLTNGNIGISVNGTESMQITPSGLVVNGNVTCGTIYGDGSSLTNASFNTYVSNIQVANSTYVVQDDMAVSTTNGGFVVINGSGFLGGSMVLIGGTPATSTTVLSYTRLGAAVQPKAAGTYSVTVVRPDSISINVPLGITYSASPLWSTASDLGNVFWTESYTKSLAASSDSTVVYSNTTALPSSSTLASNGTLTGTVVDPTTTLYTFTIRATDTELEYSDRDFSINYINPFVPADAIYSLRKVNSSYTGNCIQVRRSSDNAVANIGFVSSTLDTSSLLTFVGSGNDGFVSVWYDQSGFGRNVSQATAANQPGIVGNGVVVREGTSPALWFSGSSYLDGGDILDFGANSWATVTTAKVHNGTNEQMLWSKSSTAAGTGRYYLDSVPASLLSYGYTDDTVPTYAVVYHDPRDHSVYSLKYTRGTNFRFKVNSGIETVTTVTPTVTGNTSYPFRLGCYTNSDGTSPMLYLFGTIQEHVHYVSLVSDTYRAAMETNMTKVYKPIPITSVIATGGTVTTVGGYTIHAFTSSGNFVTSVDGQVEYLVVAGGGGGGGGTGAGGGGGGVIQGIISLTAGTYTVTIGGGGAGAGYVSPYSPGTNGQNSVFGTLTAFGGGGGGSNASGFLYGVRGGSGGGSLGSTGQGLGIPGQGFAGGVTNFTTPYYGGGSGGGAGGPGVDGTSSAGGNGGPGMMSSISGAVAYYAGGGGGGTYAGGTLGSGGTGGGGAGGGFNGTANTGGGGGGQKDNSTTLAGTGGSGIVYLRYMLTPYIPSLIATGGTMSSAGAYTVHTFTTSGSFTVTSNPANKTLEILVVAGGGGGGGGHAGGGGGGGGLISSTAVSATNGSYTITVGGGGTGGSGPPLAGSNSSAFGSTAIGGGRGGQESYNPGGLGGSGGGGCGVLGNHTGGSGTAGQGYAGGSGNNSISGGYGVGGGGGGAGQAGANAFNSGGYGGGNGGNGLSSSITGTAVYYAGGGGGGGWIGYVYGGIGGLGGGGYSVSGSVGLPGTANTGGGGAGGDAGASPRGGGAGGSGIVIIRYIA